MQNQFNDYQLGYLDDASYHAMLAAAAGSYQRWRDLGLRLDEFDPQFVQVVQAEREIRRSKDDQYPIVPVGVYGGGITALVDIDTNRLRALTPHDGPVVMLNLYRFKSQNDGDRFRESMTRLMRPVLERLGAETLYSGSVAGESFIELFADTELDNEIEELRLSTLTASRFMVTTQ
jgi:hypothetical protein